MVRPAFFKLCFANHLWSSISALVVLQNYWRKLKWIACNIIIKISEFGNDTWQSPFTFLPILTFIEFITLSIYRLPILLSATKEGFKALWTWCFLPYFTSTSIAASVTQAGPPEYIIEQRCPQEQLRSVARSMRAKWEWREHENKFSGGIQDTSRVLLYTWFYVIKKKLVTKHCHNLTQE